MSSSDDGTRKGGAPVEDDHKPWWADHPELVAQRTHGGLSQGQCMLLEDASSSDDGPGKGGALVEDDHKPWWADDPELVAIRRRVLEEIECAQREPIEPDKPDPVVEDMLSGASWRELADARDDLSRARARYEKAIRTARVVGLSWGEIGRVLGVPRQALHRRFRTIAPPRTP
jgi:hypothetical protein